MKTLIRVITAAAICLATQGSVAQTTFGVPDCGEWLAGQRIEQRSWLMGYLTALNLVHSALKKEDGLSALSSAKQAYAWMDNYCKANPLSDLSYGGGELFSELAKKARTRK